MIEDWNCRTSEFMPSEDRRTDSNRERAQRHFLSVLGKNMRDHKLRVGFSQPVKRPIAFKSFPANHSESNIGFLESRAVIRSVPRHRNNLQTKKSQYKKYMRFEWHKEQKVQNSFSVKKIDRDLDRSSPRNFHIT